MAVIGSIRKRSGLLLIIIGVAILLFVLGDIFGGGVGQAVPEAGSIAGESVDANQLEKEAARIEALYNSYGQNISRDQARKQAWAEMVRQKVYYKGIAASGMTVTEEEFDDARWGESVLSEFTTNESYKGADGQFSPDSVQSRYANLYNDERSRPVYFAEKKRIKESRLSNKYNTLVAKGVYYNTLDAKDDAMGSMQKVSFQYVTKKYSSIPDSTITVSDEQLRTYYNEHKNEKGFEQDESRSVEYIVFPVLPSKQDEEDIKEELADIAKDFARDDVNDSTFVLRNTDVGLYSTIPYVKGSRVDEFEAQFANGAVGTVVGPYKLNNTYKIAKIVSKAPKKESKVRHILLKSPADDAVIEGRADSILRVLKRGGDFDALASKFTEDPGFAQNQGIYDWFDKNINFVPEFKDFSLENPEGTMDVVKTSHGYHIMEVLGRREDEQSQIVEITKNIVPGSDTFEKFYSESSAFTIDYGTSEEKFAAGAEELGYKVEKLSDLKMTANAIGPVTDAREAVLWAYNDERYKGEVSNAFSIGEYYLVLKFVSKREKGVPEFDDVVEKVTKEVIKEEKGRQLSEMVSGASDLESAAAALDSKVSDANDVTYSATGIPGAGEEPKIIGTALSIPEGQLSGPIQGKSGVFLIKVNSRIGELRTEQDVSTNRKSLMRKAETTIRGKVQAAMNKAAGVESAVDKLY